MSNEDYCKRMYLIPQQDYDEYYQLKHNQTKKNDLSELEEKSGKNELLESTYDPQQSEQPSEQQQQQQPMSEETLGEGKISNDILLKRKNADFQTRKNIEKNLEDQITQKIYAKILPLLEQNAQITKKSLQELFEESSNGKKKAQNL